MLNTEGQDHPGDAFNADGGASTCGSCHWNMSVKATTYSSITSTNGYCYRCHYGTEGDGAGFVDTRK